MSECKWVDARNDKIVSGEICLTCNRIRSGNQDDE